MKKIIIILASILFLGIQIPNQAFASEVGDNLAASGAFTCDNNIIDIDLIAFIEDYNDNGQNLDRYDFMDDEDEVDGFFDSDCWQDAQIIKYDMDSDFLDDFSENVEFLELFTNNLSILNDSFFENKTVDISVNDGNFNFPLQDIIDYFTDSYMGVNHLKLFVSNAKTPEGADVNIPAGLTLELPGSDDSLIIPNGAKIINAGNLIVNGEIKGEEGYDAVIEKSGNGTISGTGKINGETVEEYLNNNPDWHPSVSAQPANSNSNNGPALTSDPNGQTPSLINAIKPAETVASFVTNNGLPIFVASGDFAHKLGNTPGIKATPTGIELNEAYNGMNLHVIVYSEPKYAGSGIVENGKLAVDLSSFTGNHDFLVVNDNSQIVAKASTYPAVNEAKIMKTGSTSQFVIVGLLALVLISAFAFRKNFK